ncbi:hypothetical protein ACSBR2_023262 [Camellia fascicularis]
MGLSLSSILSTSKEILNNNPFCLTEDENTVIIRSISFDSNDRETLRQVSFKRSDSNKSNASDCPESLVIEETLRFQKWKPEKLKLETTVFYKDLLLYGENLNSKTKDDESIPAKSFPEMETLFSPRPASEFEAAAIKVQKVYKSYRTRRNLADCAVVVEELWWKALDFATLKQSSISFFNLEKPESAVSRWARARTRAAKVGKGLSKDEKAKKLALRHWLEAIDPRHRYGHNLHLYYNVWFNSQSSQPFFYWLDVGDGKEMNLENCPRTILQHQCIKYLGPKEREAYEVIVEGGKLAYKQSGVLLETIEGSKWIFVLSTSRNLYVGQKKKGLFQHSSFLAGGATTAAGRLVAHNGLLEAIWPYSGHYHPTEENFMEFISFLEEHNVDLTSVRRCAIDDDDPSLKGITSEEMKLEFMRGSNKETMQPTNIETTDARKLTMDTTISTIQQEHNVDISVDDVKVPVFKLGKHLSSKWTTGAGPRIGCVREYPPELQFQALEHVNLSPRINPGPLSSSTRPIPSPRPSPKIHLSPSLLNMGLPSPRLHVPIAN